MPVENYPSQLATKGAPDTEPVITEQDTTNKWWDKIHTSQTRKRKISRDWLRFYQLYAGKHWGVARPEWMAEPVINYTFATIETILPILTDNRPQIAVVPAEPDDATIADVISRIVEVIWEFNDMDITLPKIMKNALVFGNGFAKVDWNPAARMGMGEIRVVGVDPEYILLDPDALDQESAMWMAQVMNVPLDYLKQNPEWAKRIPDIRPGEQEPDFNIERNVTSQRARGMFQPMSIRNTDGANALSTTVTFAGQPEGTPYRDDSKRCTLAEIWSREYDETGRIQMRKTVIANNVVLEDGPSPFKHNEFPFVHFVDYPLGWQYWAMGEVQQVEKLQLEINKRRGLMIDILKFTSMPLLVVDPTSGVDYENLVTRPGLVIPAIGGQQAVAWLHPPAMPGELFAMNDRDKADFDAILGNVDVLQGRRPVGVEAAAAIEALNEAANTRMRLKVRFMEAALRQLGRLVVNMIQQYYTTARVIRVVGRDAESLLVPETDFIQINEPTGIDQEGNPQLKNAIPPDAEFDVRIGAGSTLPVSRLTRFQQAMQLYQVRAIDRPELLKAAAWPRWEEVEARMEQQEQAMMGMEQIGAQNGKA